MKRFLFAALFSAFSATACFAQLPVQIPDGFKVESPEDCERQQKNVLPIINWLDTAPLETENPDYKKARAFITEWTTWSESVDIQIDPRMVKYSESSPDLLLYFITGWTKFELQNPGNTDNIKKNKAGLESVINFYKSQKDLPVNDDLDELYALKQKGQLEAWVKKQLEAPQE